MTLLLGYLGPGAGLGFLGSLLAVALVIGVGLLGLVLYPLKVVWSWCRKQSVERPLNETSSPQIPVSCD